jgi:hypothetical protein
LKGGETPRSVQHDQLGRGNDRGRKSTMEAAKNDKISVWWLVVSWTMEREAERPATAQKMTMKTMRGEPDSGNGGIVTFWPINVTTRRQIVTIE